MKSMYCRRLTRMNGLPFTHETREFYNVTDDAPNGSHYCHSSHVCLDTALRQLLRNVIHGGTALSIRRGDGVVVRLFDVSQSSEGKLLLTLSNKGLFVHDVAALARHQDMVLKLLKEAKKHCFSGNLEPVGGAC